MSRLRALVVTAAGALAAGALAFAIHAASTSGADEPEPGWLDSFDDVQGTWVSSVGFAYDGTEPWRAPVRLTVDGDRLMLHAGCNTMSGTVEIREHRLYADGLATTEMGCEPAAMARDAWVAALVEDHATIQLQGSTEGAMLALDSDAGWIGFVRR